MQNEKEYYWIYDTLWPSSEMHVIKFVRLNYELQIWICKLLH